MVSFSSGSGAESAAGLNQWEIREKTDWSVMSNSCAQRVRFDRGDAGFYDPRAMGLTTSLSRRIAVLVIGVAGCLATVSCERGGTGAPAAGGGRRVASLVPAATDMLVGMGAKAHLVAVSNF